MGPQGCTVTKCNIVCLSRSVSVEENLLFNSKVTVRPNLSRRSHKLFSKYFISEFCKDFTVPLFSLVIKGNICHLMNLCNCHFNSENKKVPLKCRK